MPRFCGGRRRSPGGSAAVVTSCRVRTLVILCSLLVSLPAVARLAQARTAISLEILADGTCSVGVRGSGARSEMSYLPRTPGRCAIPATRGAGAVHLEVRLPQGAAVPAASIPEMSWRIVEGRPLGVADLDSAPAFVDVMPPRRSMPSRVVSAALLVLAAGAAVWATYGWFQRRRA